MAYRVRAVRDAEEYRAALGGIGHYFGWAPTAEDAERFGALLQHERMHAVFDDGHVVAGRGRLRVRAHAPRRGDAVRRRHGRRGVAVAPAPRAPSADDGAAVARCP